MLHVLQQEVGHVLADLCGDGVGILERACLVGDVALHNADDAVGIYFYVRLSDAVAGAGNHNRRAVGMVFNLVNVVNAHARRFVEGVKFDDDAFGGQPAIGGTDAAGGC